MSIEPIKIPKFEELPEVADEHMFNLQVANIRTANALTALAIHSGAMTPDGEFVLPQKDSEDQKQTDE